MPDQTPLPRTWLESDRVIPTRFARPLKRFTSLEAASAIVLLAAAIAALLWANLPIFGDSYTEFWETKPAAGTNRLRNRDCWSIRSTRDRASTGA